MTEQKQDRDVDMPGGDTGSASDVESGAVGRSMGVGGGAGPTARETGSSWQDQTEAETGGAMGQEGVEGGESWGDQSRDIGTSGYNTGDAGFGSETGDDGGPKRDASAGAGESGGSFGSGEQTERS